MVLETWVFKSLVHIFKRNMAKLEKIQLELAGKVLFCFSCALRDEGFHRREIGMGLGSEREGDSEAGARALRGQQERGIQAVILGQRCHH